MPNFIPEDQIELALVQKLDVALKTLTATRDLLLPRLISGKLRVEDLNIQFPPGMEEMNSWTCEIITKVDAQTLPLGSIRVNNCEEITANLS